MRAPIVLCLLAAPLFIAGTGQAHAQNEDPSEDVRELQEPAGEAVDLELANPNVTEEEVEWQGEEAPAEEPTESEDS